MENANLKREKFQPAPRLGVHDVLFWLFVGERHCGRHFRSKIDGQNLQRGEAVWETQRKRQNDGENFRP